MELNKTIWKSYTVLLSVRHGWKDKVIALKSGGQIPKHLGMVIPLSCLFKGSVCLVLTKEKVLPRDSRSTHRHYQALTGQSCIIVKSLITWHCLEVVIQALAWVNSQGDRCLCWDVSYHHGRLSSQRVLETTSSSQSSCLQSFSYPQLATSLSGL